MGERDAFGREKDEDTLKEMGWRADLSPDAPKPQPQPVKPASVQWTAPKPAEPPTAEQQATRVIIESAGAASPWAAAAANASAATPPAPPAWTAPAPMSRRQRKRRGRSFSRLIFFLVLIVIVAATAGSLIKLGTDTIHKGTTAIRGALPTPVTQDKIPSQSSLVKAGALRSVLDQLPAGQLKSFKLTPGTIDAQVVADGKLTMVHITNDGNMTTLKAPVSLPGKALKIDPSAPARIIRNAHKHQSDLDYMIVTGIAGTPTWTVFFKDGSNYSANLKGTKVHKLGA